MERTNSMMLWNKKCMLTRSLEYISPSWAALVSSFSLIVDLGKLEKRQKFLWKVVWVKLWLGSHGILVLDLISNVKQ